MGVLRDEQSVAASGTVTNLVAGTKYEFMSRNSVVEVFAVQDGADAGSLRMDVSFGNVLEGDNLAVPTFSATLGPDKDKHKLISALAQAGDRLQLKITNQDAVNASALRWLVNVVAV